MKLLKRMGFPETEKSKPSSSLITKATAAISKRLKALDNLLIAFKTEQNPGKLSIKPCPYTNPLKCQGFLCRM